MEQEKSNWFEGRLFGDRVPVKGKEREEVEQELADALAARERFLADPDSELFFDEELNSEMIAFRRYLLSGSDEDYKNYLKYVGIV